MNPPEILEASETCRGEGLVLRDLVGAAGQVSVWTDWAVDAPEVVAGQRWVGDVLGLSVLEVFARPGSLSMLPVSVQGDPSCPYRSYARLPVLWVVSDPVAGWTGAAPGDFVVEESMHESPFRWRTWGPGVVTFTLPARDAVEARWSAIAGESVQLERLTFELIPGRTLRFTLAGTAGTTPVDGTLDVRWTRPPN